MDNETFVISEEFYEKLEYLKKMAKLEDARQEGFMEGFIKSFELTSGKPLKSCSKQDKIRIANTLLDNHILIEVISKYTGLSFEEVNNLHRKKILRN